MSNIADSDSASFPEVFTRIADLAEELTAHPDPAVAESVAELLDWVDAFHRDGIGRLVDMVREWRGEIFLEAVARDPIASELMAAYGIGEARDLKVEAEDAVDKALDQVRPLVESHGGKLDVVSIIDGVVTVSMQGTCDGCPSADDTLVYGVKAALTEHWDNFRGLQLDEELSEPDPAKADLECVTVPKEENWTRVELRSRP